MEVSWSRDGDKAREQVGRREGGQTSTGRQVGRHCRMQQRNKAGEQVGRREGRHGAGGKAWGRWEVGREQGAGADGKWTVHVGKRGHARGKADRGQEAGGAGGQEGRQGYLLERVKDPPERCPVIIRTKPGIIGTLVSME